MSLRRFVPGGKVDMRLKSGAQFPVQELDECLLRYRCMVSRDQVIAIEIEP